MAGHDANKVRCVCSEVDCSGGVISVVRWKDNGRLVKKESTTAISQASSRVVGSSVQCCLAAGVCMQASRQASICCLSRDVLPHRRIC